MALVDSVIINRLTTDSKAINGINLEMLINEVALESTLVPVDILNHNEPKDNIVTEVHDMKFSVKKYNSTLRIARANQEFNEQLSRSPLGPITRDDLFRELAPLFQGSGPNGGPFPYAVCLIHHHVPLESGERMVTYGEPTVQQPAFTRPSRDLEGITADRWFSTGEEFEHKIIEGGEAPPPPADFLAKFREITTTRGVNILGVCVAPDTSNLSPGQVFLEKEVPGKRELELSIAPQPQLGIRNIYQTVWILTENPNVMWMCSHLCTSDNHLEDFVL